MAKKAREISKTGIYHVYARGINHQRIFESDRDDHKFLEILKQVKQKFGFELYAYCLMENHFHLLLKEKEMGEISVIMERLLSTYVAWYNTKYHRSGGLIADRFKSKPVDLDRYFWALIGYIHLNPVEEHIVPKAGYYLYSSYHEYVGRAELIDVPQAKNLVPEGTFEDWHRPRLAERYKRLYEHQERSRRLLTTILICSQGILPKHIETLEIAQRNAIIVRMAQAGLSVRKIERATGISRGIITRIVQQSRSMPTWRR